MTVANVKEKRKRRVFENIGSRGEYLGPIRIRMEMGTEEGFTIRNFIVSMLT